MSVEVLYLRCAGLDVHRDTVVACARIVNGGDVQQHVKTFGTTTSELLALSEWLSEHGVTHVAMEATGVYWKPVARPGGLLRPRARQCDAVTLPRLSSHT